MLELIERIPVCPHGKKEDLDFKLLVALTRLEDIIGEPLVYVSGYRCFDCNRMARGAENSAHLRGLAVDIKCVTSGQRYRIAESCYEVEIFRIGLGRTFVHVDVDALLPQKVLWEY